MTMGLATGLVGALGDLSATHMGKILIFTVDTASGEPSEVVGVLYDITHERPVFGGPDTTVQVRTEKRFETFTLPSEHRCELEEVPVSDVG